MKLSFNLRQATLTAGICATCGLLSNYILLADDNMFILAGLFGVCIPLGNYSRIKTKKWLGFLLSIVFVLPIVLFSTLGHTVLQSVHSGSALYGACVLSGLLLFFSTAIYIKVDNYRVALLIVALLSLLVPLFLALIRFCYRGLMSELSPLLIAWEIIMGFAISLACGSGIKPKNSSTALP